MSGIDLLFGAAIDYERTHQLALYTLLEKSDFPCVLLGFAKTKPVDWEPERQLFDLAVTGNERRVFVELKMWSFLTDKQLGRQLQFLAASGHTGKYVLLGTSWFEFDDEKIQRASKGTATRIGYDELIGALNRLLALPGQSPDICELALAYRNAIQGQFDDLKKAAMTSRPKDKVYYYSLYRMLQNRLQDLETDIYSAQNPGGPVYILNDRHWMSLSVAGAEVRLLCEVVNGNLCVKFFVDTDDPAKKRGIRKEIREATHRVLGNRYHLIDTGRLGAYMTACQLQHDFGDVASLDCSARLFRDVDAALPQIAQAISPVIGRTCSQHSHAAGSE